LLRDLVKAFGKPGAAAVLGVPRLTLQHWLTGRRHPSAGAARGIWWTWIVVLHPGRVRCLADIVTWGRWKIERQPASPGDWSGWSI